MNCPLFLAKFLIRTGIARLLPFVQRWTDGGGAYLHYYSDRVLASPHRDLLEASAYLDVQRPDAIDLSLGAPRFDLVPGSSTKLPADRRGWPPPGGLPELRTAIAGKLLTDNQLALSPTTEVLVTSGATGAIFTAFDTFLNPGDRVVLFDPASPLFSFALRQRLAQIRWVPTYMEDGRLRFRLDLLARALRRARMVVVNSPANPTGGVIAAEDLEQLAWWANRYDVLILSDEVFERYEYTGEAVSIGTLPRARGRTLTVGSLSKSHALASARVGWLAGCRHLVRPAALSAALQSPFVPTVCQQIALTALRHPVEAFEPMRNEFESRRRYAYERLEAMGFPVPWPAGAFFFWLPVSHLGLDGRSFAEELVRVKKVLVTPGHFFGPSGANYVRLSYATEDGRLREGLARLADFIGDRQGVEMKQAA